jgi:hypothetical protein
MEERRKRALSRARAAMNDGDVCMEKVRAIAGVCESFEQAGGAIKRPLPRSQARSASLAEDSPMARQRGGAHASSQGARWARRRAHRRQSPCRRPHRAVRRPPRPTSRAQLPRRRSSAPCLRSVRHSLADGTTYPASEPPTHASAPGANAGARPAPAALVVSASGGDG